MHELGKLLPSIPKKAAGGVLTAKQAPAARHRPALVCAGTPMSRHSCRRPTWKGERTMSFHSWLQNLRSALAPGRGQRQHARAARFEPRRIGQSLEVLEDRCLPSFTPVAIYAVGVQRWSPCGGLQQRHRPGPRPVRPTCCSATATARSAGPGSGLRSGTSIAVGDFDGDGNLDLAAATGPRVRAVLLGNGDGTFTAADTFAVAGPEASLSSVAVGDFNGDGMLDLGVTIKHLFTTATTPTTATCGHFKGTVHVLLGDGSGGFLGAEHHRRSATGISGKPAVADFNGDGIDDLATPNRHVGGQRAAGRRQRLPPNLHRASPVPTPPRWPRGLDGDLDADLVTTNQSTAPASSVLLGDGAGGFGSPGDLRHRQRPTSVALADFNGDGTLDIVTTSNIGTLAGTARATSTSCWVTAMGLSPPRSTSTWTRPCLPSWPPATSTATDWRTWR